MTGEAPSARTFGLRFLLPLAGIALVVACAGLALRPPRVAWGTSYRDPACPRGFKAMVVYGQTGLEDLRLRLSGNRFVFVFVPPRGQASDRWPRFTGRMRDETENQHGFEEIELGPP